MFNVIILQLSLEDNFTVTGPFPFIISIAIVLHFHNRSDSEYRPFCYLMRLNVPISIVGWLSQHRI